jgi:hypothetical protein
MNDYENLTNEALAKLSVRVRRACLTGDYEAFGTYGTAEQVGVQVMNEQQRRAAQQHHSRPAWLEDAE